MGMAASQARYLELTARQTNVEYAGQQINQQRTQLANESAGMFNQLMGLQVPTAPSSADYTSTNYTFNNGANTNTIDEGGIVPLSGQANYNANVTYTYPQTNYTGMFTTRTDLGVKNVSGTYWLTNGSSTNPINQVKLDQCVATESTQVAALTQICKDNPTSNLVALLGYPTASGTINTALIGNAYTYKNDSGTVYYYSSTDLATMPADGSAHSLANYYAADITTNKKVTEMAYVTTASSGRYSSIKLQSQSNTLALNSTTTTDSNAYEDAVNEYEYQQQIYNQQVTSINAKTSVIQQEDKTLELQLKQLDTEQQALSTEMDSVKKVIDKNIEQTFKTFS